MYTNSIRHKMDIQEYKVFIHLLLQCPIQTGLMYSTGHRCNDFNKKIKDLTLYSGCLKTFDSSATQWHLRALFATKLKLKLSTVRP